MIADLIDAAGFVILFFALTAGLTVLFETPVIVCGGVTKNKAYICGVNIVTNVLLNMSLFGILLLGKTGMDQGVLESVRTGWLILAEAAVIPVAEALAYRKISEAGTKRIFLFTYLANLISFGAGLVLDVLVRKFF